MWNIRSHANFFHLKNNHDRELQSQSGTLSNELRGDVRRSREDFHSSCGVVVANFEFEGRRIHLGHLKRETEIAQSEHKR